MDAVYFSLSVSQARLTLLWMIIDHQERLKNTLGISIILNSERNEMFPVYGPTLLFCPQNQRDKFFSQDVASSQY